MNSIYDNTFEHHGIKGQKWGERNGPPYPLDEHKGSGSSHKHRLLSLFRKRDKTENEAKEDKKAKEASDVNMRDLRLMFKTVFKHKGDDAIDRAIERYLNRANNDVDLLSTLLRYDLEAAIKTHEWVEHEPKDLPRNYLDKLRSVNQKEG